MSLRKPEPIGMGLEECGEEMVVSVQEEEAEGPVSPTFGPQGFFLPRSKLMMQCRDKTRQSFHKNCLTVFQASGTKPSPGNSPWGASRQGTGNFNSI